MYYRIFAELLHFSHFKLEKKNCHKNCSTLQLFKLLNLPKNVSEMASEGHLRFLIAKKFYYIYICKEEKRKFAKTLFCSPSNYLAVTKDIQSFVYLRKIKDTF